MSNYLHALRGRNIPAYAGRTSAAWRSNNKPQKHPRIRGENSVTRNAHFANVETSPHTRGKLDPDTVLGLILGNIPAYAGKAHCRQGGNAQRQKHPRIRGESLIALLNICFLRETSPHTRGKLRTLGYIESKRGNIPAYAGKAKDRSRNMSRRKKHPRIRGESFSYD